MSKPLNEIQHVGLPTANILDALGDRETRRAHETGDWEVCYLAVGATLARLSMHIERQMRSQPWERQYICNPQELDSVKIIVFAYRASLDHAISAYARFEVPATEVTKDDIPFLVRAGNEIIVGYDNPILNLAGGCALKRLITSMRQVQYDEIMLLLKDPPSAEIAAWLLNSRNKLYGGSASIKIEDLPWSIRVTDWDILPCKAIHHDGQVVIFDGEWKSLPLNDFWHRHCKTLKFHQTNILDLWHLQIERAILTKSIESDQITDEDEDNTFICDDSDD